MISLKIHHKIILQLIHREYILQNLWKTASLALNEIIFYLYIFLNKYVFLNQLYVYCFSSKSSNLENFQDFLSYIL